MITMIDLLEETSIGGPKTTDQVKTEETTETCSGQQQWDAQSVWCSIRLYIVFQSCRYVFYHSHVALIACMYGSMNLSIYDMCVCTYVCMYQNL